MKAAEIINRSRPQSKRDSEWARTTQQELELTLRKAGQAAREKALKTKDAKDIAFATFLLNHPPLFQGADAEILVQLEFASMLSRVGKPIQAGDEYKELGANARTDGEEIGGDSRPRVVSRALKHRGLLALPSNIEPSPPSSSRYVRLESKFMLAAIAYEKVFGSTPESLQADAKLDCSTHVTDVTGWFDQQLR